MVALGLLFALAIGLSLGMLGGGGSILTVPVLHYVLGRNTHDAIAMSLAIVGMTSVVAVLSHARRGLVRWRIGLPFGARVVRRISVDHLQRAFGGFVIAAGALILSQGIWA